MEVHRRLIGTDPAYVAARSAIETLAFQYQRRLSLVQRTGIATIPVVVHVVYRIAQQNISDAQVASQIAVLNRDYRGQGKGTPSLPATFAGLRADPRIEFVLAKTDPQGNPATGITRTATMVSGFATDDSMKFAQRGGADAWPRDGYLNIWVCSLAGGVLGYAQLPGGPAATDGVVITYTAFGTIGTATSPFHLGRTATHEVGHWLNLLHIWGDDATGCNGDDFVPDTPNQAGPNFGTPSFPKVTCDNAPSGDLFFNFMDYTDDGCMQMFTSGQATRMDATLDGPRALLIGQVPVPMPTPTPTPTPTPIPNATLDLLFYDRSAGVADLYAFDGQGNAALLQHYDSWRTTWDAIAAADLSSGTGVELLFYDRETGEVQIYAVDAQSGFSLVGGGNWRPNWDAVAAGSLTGGGIRNVLLYRKAAGEAELHVLDANGNPSLLRPYSGWRTTWDAIVAGGPTGDGAGNLLFYDRAAGHAELYAIDGGGSFSLLQQYEDLGTNWDVVVRGNLTGAENLLLYDRRAGEATLLAVSGDGAVSQLRHYTGWRTTWDVISAGDLSSSAQRMKSALVSSVLSRLQLSSVIELV
jgi:hypothetical protein